ncbi:hypothetical protein C8J57DRAFT_1514430 [Mycena rebaudengoi]|nr:hypothetical protein C8J57DRAFT_1514430 [Mycena rebaudengoi]
MNDNNLNSPAAFDPNLRYFLQPQPQPVYNEDLSQRGTFFDMHEAVAKSNFLCPLDDTVARSGVLRDLDEGGPHCGLQFPSSDDESRLASTPHLFEKLNASSLPPNAAGFGTTNTAFATTDGLAFYPISRNTLHVLDAALHDGGVSPTYAIPNEALHGGEFDQPLNMHGMRCAFDPVGLPVSQWQARAAVVRAPLKEAKMRTTAAASASAYSGEMSTEYPRRGSRAYAIHGNRPPAEEQYQYPRSSYGLRSTTGVSTSSLSQALTFVLEDPFRRHREASPTSASQSNRPTSANRGRHSFSPTTSIDSQGRVDSYVAQVSHALHDPVSQRHPHQPKKVQILQNVHPRYVGTTLTCAILRTHPHPDADADATNLALSPCQCGDPIDTLSNIRNHLLSAHGLETANNRSDTQMPCVWPGCTFKILPRSLPRHIMNQHIKSSHFECPYCQVLHATKRQLETHLKKNCENYLTGVGLWEGRPSKRRRIVKGEDEE